MSRAIPVTLRGSSRAEHGRDACMLTPTHTPRVRVLCRGWPPLLHRARLPPVASQRVRPIAFRIYSELVMRDWPISAPGFPPFQTGSRPWCSRAGRKEPAASPGPGPRGAGALVRWYELGGEGSEGVVGDEGLAPQRQVALRGLRDESRQHQERLSTCCSAPRCGSAFAVSSTRAAAQQYPVLTQSAACDAPRDCGSRLSRSAAARRRRALLHSA